MIYSTIAASPSEPSIHRISIRSAPPGSTLAEVITGAGTEKSKTSRGVIVSLSSVFQTNVPVVRSSAKSNSTAEMLITPVRLST